MVKVRIHLDPVVRKDCWVCNESLDKIDKVHARPARGYSARCFRTLSVHWVLLFFVTPKLARGGRRGDLLVVHRPSSQYVAASPL